MNQQLETPQPSAQEIDQSSLGSAEMTVMDEARQGVLRYFDEVELEDADKAVVTNYANQVAAAALREYQAFKDTDPISQIRQATEATLATLTKDGNTDDVRRLEKFLGNLNSVPAQWREVVSTEIRQAQMTGQEITEEIAIDRIMSASDPKRKLATTIRVSSDWSDDGQTETNDMLTRDSATTLLRNFESLPSNGVWADVTSLPSDSANPRGYLTRENNNIAISLPTKFDGVEFKWWRKGGGGAYEYLSFSKQAILRAVKPMKPVSPVSPAKV